MTTARLWVALLGFGAALVSVHACSDVESCVEGIDPGCRGSEPDDSGNCRFGLVASADGFVCQKPGAVTGMNPRPDGGGNNPGTDAGGVPNPMGNCSCASGEICRRDNTCVDTCDAVPNVPPSKSAPLTCRPGPTETQFNFQRAAQGLCSQLCVRRAALCGTDCRVDVECQAAAAMVAATQACPALDAECAMQRCEAARDKPCTQQECPAGAAPNCTGVVCANTCPQFTNDGLCDDGDLSNADSYVCDYGTDCGDCGPRRGTAPAKRLDYGDPCVDPAQCGGDLYSVKTSTGWCVPAADEQDYARCHPDCSNNKSCPAGFACEGVAQEIDGQLVQLEDLNDGTLVFACFSMQCGS